MKKFLIMFLLLPTTAFAAISPNAGTISSKFDGTSKNTIFIIEDAHSNVSAQINIYRILNQLHKENLITTVSLEGMSSIANTDLFFQFSKPVRTNVAATLLRQGKLSGAEYFKIVENPDIKFEGSENKALYELNKTCYLSVDANIINQIEPEINRINKLLPESIQSLNSESTTEKIKALIQQDEMTRFVTNMTLFKMGKMSSSKLMKYMRKLEGQIRMKLLNTTELIEIDRKVCLFKIYKSMFKFNITNDQYEIYLSNKQRFSSEYFSGRSIESIDKQFELVKEFYRLAKERDEQLVKNNLNNSSAIIVGGFHTKGIEQYLKDNNVSYRVIQPKIVRIESSEHEQYKKAMKN